MMRLVLAAGIIPVFRDADRYDYLLLRAFNYWDFPKGETEKNEDPFVCALRELKEETTITQVTFPWGKDFRETVPYGKGKVARYYLASCESRVVNLPISPELGVPEHHEYRWVSGEEARKLVSPRLLPILDWAEQKISDLSK